MNQKTPLPFISSIEPLEARIAPAVIVVTNLNNAGVGSLRQAVLDSNASTTVDDVIKFAPGLNGSIRLASTIAITDDVVINGANRIAVSGNHAVQPFIVTDLAATLLNVTLRNLSINDGDSGGTGGGGILNTENLTLKNCLITGNTTTADGGGVYSILGTLKLITCVVTGNTAGDDGGGIAVGSSTNIGGKVVLFRSIISNNTNGTGDDGGGLFSDNAIVKIASCIISGNHADEDGGGFYIDNSMNLAGLSVNIAASRVTGNTAGDNGGGGYVDDNVGPVTVANSLFNENRAATNGGGFYIDGAASTVKFLACKFNSNVTGNKGGGIFVDDGVLKMVACVVSRNAATNNAASDGGGLFIDTTAAVTIKGGSFTRNYAFDTGGGIFENAAVNPKLIGVTVKNNTSFIDPNLSGVFTIV